MKPRLPEDLVRVCVPDPGEEPLVLEEVSDLTARRTRAFRELAPVPWKFAGLRSELVETVHRARVLSLVLDVHLAHPLVVAIAEILPVIEHERERGRAHELRLRVIELEDAREHRVHDDGALVQIEDEELAAMTHAGEAAMRERRLDRPCCPKHGRISDANEHDLVTDQRLLEAAANDVKVGPLRH